MRASFQELQEQLKTELRAEKQKTESLQQPFEFQEITERMKAEQNAFKQKMEQGFVLLQHEASEREKSFHSEMEDLKSELNSNLC